MNATNGYFAHGTGIKNRALAGAGVAFPQDAMASATNPAGMVFVGDRYDLGLVIFSPDRGYSTSDSLANGMGGAFTIGPDTQDSGDNLFLIPCFGINKMITERDAIGLWVYGNGGLNTTYRSGGGSATFDPDASPFGNGPAPVTTFAGVFGGVQLVLICPNYLLIFPMRINLLILCQLGLAQYLQCNHFGVMV